MAERGYTQNCEPLFKELTDNYREIAAKCGLNDTSIRKFRKGNIVIRRTTFNKIRNCLASDYGVEFNPDEHWIETD